MSIKQLKLRAIQTNASSFASSRSMTTSPSPAWSLLMSSILCVTCATWVEVGWFTLEQFPLKTPWCATALRNVARHSQACLCWLCSLACKIIYCRKDSGNVNAPLTPLFEFQHRHWITSMITITLTEGTLLIFFAIKG